MKTEANRQFHLIHDSQYSNEGMNPLAANTAEAPTGLACLKVPTDEPALLFAGSDGTPTLGILGDPVDTTAGESLCCLQAVSTSHRALLLMLKPENVRGRLRVNGQTAQPVTLLDPGDSRRRGDARGARLVAFFAAIFLATSFWHVVVSRLGVRPVLAPCYLVWAFYFFFRGLRAGSGRASALFAVLGGVVYGLGFHSYLAFRATPLLLVLLVPGLAEAEARRVALRPIAGADDQLELRKSLSEAAAEALADTPLDPRTGRRPALLAVTILTSLSEQEMGEVSPSHDTLQDRIQRLARLAWDCGCDGLVCSPTDLPGLRAALGPDPLIVTPGIRPAGADTGDQVRVATPAQAMASGADFLVIGRPITKAPDPGAALAAIAAELD